MMNGQITYYDWVPFFNAICEVLEMVASDLETRETRLLEIAESTFHEDHRILTNDRIDPFSYIYALAQRNTVNQRQQIFTRAANACGLSVPIPTDWVFPTPTPNTLSLFYAQGAYIDGEGQEVGNECLWDLFVQVYTGADIREEDFLKTLIVKNVGFTKLSQALFLIAPDRFMPFEKQMNSFPGHGFDDLSQLVKQIEKEGIQVYFSTIEQLRRSFPGCKLYEINLFNVLAHDYNPLRISGRYCQISSWAEGQGQEDYFGDFVSENAVWTGGATSSSGNNIYPLTEYDRGDIVLARRGTKWLGGIGLIVRNNYVPDGFNPNSSIDVIWLAKERRKIEGTGLGQWNGFSHASENTIQKFRETYPETFQVIDKIHQEQRVVISHSAIRHKNVILQGPPGTGKTRLAKQIAKYLVSEGEKEFDSLIDIVEKSLYSEDTNIQGSDQIKLIQFHPSYTYEDFVRGIKADVNEDGLMNYKVENRILGQFIDKAALAENRSNAYVLIIDEINRANLTSVLGELIYALEYRGESVDSLYALEGDNTISIPENLYIIGTMNTADRSLGHLDYAIRRRFAFIPVLPNAEVITEPKSKELFEKVEQIFIENTSPEFNKNDVQMGHSYFLAQESELLHKLDYEIKPLLYEYVKDGVLLQSAVEFIEELSV